MFGVGTTVVVGVLIAGLWWIRGEGLDPQGCPKKSGPSREIIVLLDTSDPLNDKHRAELGRILREMTNPAVSGRHTALAVRAGERVSFYRLSSTGPPKSPLEQICNPGGDPEKRSWIEYLTKGSVIDKWRHDRFVRKIEGLFPEEDGPPQPASPLLETVAVITARHAPSGRANQDTGPAHLIVISDLLQHTSMLSHYGPYPEPDSLPRELWSDLSRVEVSLFRIERHKYAKFQTPEHYYWWTDFVEAMDGGVVWQQAL
jgi:hypothetical protein